MKLSEPAVSKELCSCVFCRFDLRSIGAISSLLATPYQNSSRACSVVNDDNPSHQFGMIFSTVASHWKLVSLLLQIPNRRVHRESDAFHDLNFHSAALPLQRAALTSSSSTNQLAILSPKAKCSYDTAKGRHLVCTDAINPGEQVLQESPVVKWRAESHQQRTNNSHDENGEGDTVGSEVLFDWAFSGKHALALHLTLIELKLCKPKKSESQGQEKDAWTINSHEDLLSHLTNNAQWTLEGFDSALITLCLVQYSRQRIHQMVGTGKTPNCAKPQFLSPLCTFLSQSNGASKLFAFSLFKNLRRVKFNSFAITKNIDGQKSNKSCSSTTVATRHTRIGMGVFLKAAHLNHSCRPNSIVKFEGHDDEQLVLVALEPIRQGEEITISYGPLQQIMTTVVRQEILQQNYCFMCGCSACKESQQGTGDSGSTFFDEVEICGINECRGELKSSSPARSSKSKEGSECSLLRCPLCKHSQALEDRRRRRRRDEVRFEAGWRLLFGAQDDEDAGAAPPPAAAEEEGARLLAACLAFRDRYLHPAALAGAQCRDALARAAAERGAFPAAAAHCAAAVAALARRYPPGDPALAAERRKLAELRLRAGAAGGGGVAAAAAEARRALAALREGGALPRGDPLLVDLERLAALG